MMRRSCCRPIHLALGLAAGLALLIAACGGGQATSTPPPSKPPSTPTAAPVPPTPTPAPAGATPTTAPAPAKYGGTIQARMATTSAPANFDTYSAAGKFSFVYAVNWLNSLITLDFDNSAIIRPDLAQKWDVSQNGAVYTFQLARGVQWHDGNPFTSADVVYTLNLGWKPAAPTRAANKLLFARVTNIEAPDASSVRITLDHPSASFLPGLTSPSLLIYPAHIPDPAEWIKTRIGTGPFKFKSHTPDVAMESLRNDKYWKKDPAGRPLPYLDGITHNVLGIEPSLAAFRSGRIDCGCSFDTDFMTSNRETIKRLFPDWQEFNFYAIAYVYLNQKPPFTDKRVRQGLSAGLDRRKFAAVNERGFNYFPSFFFYQRELGAQWGLAEPEILKLPGWRTDHAADVAAAKQLFKDAGLDLSQSEVILLSSPFYPDAGPLLDEDLRNLGFRSKLVVPSAAEGTQILARGDFNVSFTTPAPAFDEPAEYFGSYVVTGGGFNYGKWTNTVVDQLYQDIDLELDAGKRRALAERLQRELLDWSVVIPVTYVGRAQGPRGYVKGYNHAKFLSIDVAGRLEYVWLDR